MSLLNALTKKSRLNAAVKTVAEARKSTGGRQEQLFLKAYAEFQDVISNDLVLAETLYNWGFALLQHARSQEGEVAIKLYEDASDKFKFCLTIDPNYLGAAIDGGVVYMELARKKAVAIDNPLYEQAKAYFERAERIHQGHAVYNLACIFALTGEDEACLAALQDSVKYGSLPAEAEILQDPDLEKVRNKEWFQEFIASLAKKAPAVPEVAAPTEAEAKVEPTPEVEDAKVELSSDTPAASAAEDVSESEPETEAKAE